MADTTIQVKPASAVFIDVPNVRARVRMRAEMLPWKRLFQNISQNQMLEGTSLLQASAYLKSWGDQESLRAQQGIQQAAFGRNIDLQYRAIDDIDSMIIDDMWTCVVQHEQESIRGGVLTYPLQIRFLLVSGDSDYLRSVKNMRKQFGDHLELELYVISWKKSLSAELQAAANKCFFLDDMSGFGALKQY